MSSISQVLEQKKSTKHEAVILEEKDELKLMNDDVDVAVEINERQTDFTNQLIEEGPPHKAELLIEMSLPMPSDNDFQDIREWLSQNMSLQSSNVESHTKSEIETTSPLIKDFKFEEKDDKDIIDAFGNVAEFPDVAEFHKTPSDFTKHHIEEIPSAKFTYEERPPLADKPLLSPDDDFQDIKDWFSRNLRPESPRIESPAQSVAKKPLIFVKHFEKPQATSGNFLSSNEYKTLKSKSTKEIEEFALNKHHCTFSSHDSVESGQKTTHSTKTVSSVDESLNHSLPLPLTEDVLKNEDDQTIEPGILFNSDIATILDESSSCTQAVVDSEKVAEKTLDANSTADTQKIVCSQNSDLAIEDRHKFDDSLSRMERIFFDRQRIGDLRKSKSLPNFLPFKRPKDYRDNCYISTWSTILHNSLHQENENPQIGNQTPINLYQVSSSGHQSRNENAEVSPLADISRTESEQMYPNFYSPTQFIYHLPVSRVSNPDQMNVLKASRFKNGIDLSSFNEETQTFDQDVSIIENEAISLATQTLLITEDVACQVEENAKHQVDVGNQTEKVINIDRLSQVFEQAPVTVAVKNKTISRAIQTFLSTKDVTNQTEDVIIVDRPSQSIDQSTFTVEIVAIDEATQTILVTEDVSVQTEKVVLFDSLQSLKQGSSKNTQTLLITEDTACQSDAFIQHQTDVANQTNEVVLVDGPTQNIIETVNRATSTTLKQKMVEQNTQTDYSQGIIDSENEVSDHEQRISVMTMNEIDGLSQPSHKLQAMNSIGHQRMDAFDQTRRNLAFNVPSQANGLQIDYQTIQGASVMTVNEIGDYVVSGKQTEVLNGPESCTSTVNHNPQRSYIDQPRRTELQELQELQQEFVTKASKIDGSFEGAQRTQFLNGPRGCTSVGSTFDNIPQRSEITGEQAAVGEVDGLAEPNALINPRDHTPVQSISNNHPDIIEETETKMRIDEKFFACNYYSKSQRMITFSQKTNFGFDFKLKPVSFRKREWLILQYFFNGFDSTNRDFVFPKICLFLVLPLLIWSAATFPLLASLFFTPDGVFYLIDEDGHYETKISTPSDLVNRLITYQSFTIILLILMLFAARPSLNNFYQKPIISYLLTNTGRERFNSRKASHFINDLFYLRLVFFFSFLYIFTNFVSIACFCLQYFQLPDNSNVNRSFYSYFFALTFPGAIFAFTTLMVAILVVKSAQFYLKIDRALKLKT